MILEQPQQPVKRPAASKPRN